MAQDVPIKLDFRSSKIAAIARRREIKATVLSAFAIVATQLSLPDLACWVGSDRPCWTFSAFAEADAHN